MKMSIKPEELCKGLPEEFIEYSTQYILLYEVVGSQYPNNGVFGTHTLFAEVKDNVTGQIATKTIENFVVKPLQLNRLHRMHRLM